MAYKPLGWPRSGRAVEARNLSADRFARIRAEVAEIREMITDGEYTRDDLLVTLSCIEHWAGDGLLVLVEQGAPFATPSDLGKRKGRGDRP